MKMIKRLAFVVAGLMVMIGVSACDVTNPLEDVELIVDVEDAQVDLGGSGIAVAVNPGQPAAQSETVNNDLDIASVNELRQIHLKPEFFSFSPSAAKSSAVAATGTLQIALFINGYPLPDMPITATVVNSVVTNVSPSAISFDGQTYNVDESAIDDLLERLPANQRPNLQDWKGASMSKVVGAINAALESNSIPLSFGIQVTDSDENDPLSGELILSAISVDAQVSQGAN